MNENNNSGEFLPVVSQQNNNVATRDTETAAVTAAAVAEVQAAYMMAIKFPRNIEAVRVRMLDAARRPGFQRAARYSKPVGSGTVQGWSIRAAEEFIRDMGNLRVTTATTFENEQERKVRVQVTDLETNASFGRELTIQKTVERKGERVLKDRPQDIISQRRNTYGDTVYIVRATEDELQQKESSAVSKVLRNEGLRLIPGDLLEEALDAINSTKAQGKTMPAAKDEARKILDAFAARGIPVKEVEEYLGCPVAQVTVSDVADLREIYVAIQSEGARWGEYLEGKRQERAPGAQGSQTGTAKTALGSAGTEAAGNGVRTRRTKRAGLIEEALAMGADGRLLAGMSAVQIQEWIDKAKKTIVVETTAQAGPSSAPAMTTPATGNVQDKEDDLDMGQQKAPAKEGKLKPGSISNDFLAD